MAPIVLFGLAGQQWRAELLEALMLAGSQVKNSTVPRREKIYELKIIDISIREYLQGFAELDSERRRCLR